MDDEVRLIDAKLLTTNIAQIAKNCARSDAQKALIGRILYMIENMPTIEAEPVKKHYDKFLKRMNGRKVMLKKVVKDMHGRYHNEYIYEIVRGDDRDQP